MIPSTIFQFLHDLSIHNNKEWFQDNKVMYQQAKEDFEAYVDHLIAMINVIDPKVGHPHAKDCVFRIFRDVRFSKNKSPYKNNFGAYIAHGGRKSPYAGYYLHIEPDNSFLGGGIYCPESSVLRAVREHILTHAEEYKNIIEEPSFKKVFREIWGERLKSAPKGFSKDDPNIDLIKPKSYTLLLNLKDNEIQSARIDAKIKKVFGLIKPYNDFINTGIKKSLSK